MPHEPYAKTLRPWLKANLGKDCLAPLTTTDNLALAAAVQVVAVWYQTRAKGLPQAFAAVVMPMQPSVRYLAYHAIAHVANWSNRDELWLVSQLPPLGRFPRCANEPREEEA